MTVMPRRRDKSESDRLARIASAAAASAAVEKSMDAVTRRPLAGRGNGIMICTLEAGTANTKESFWTYVGLSKVLGVTDSKRVKLSPWRSVAPGGSGGRIGSGAPGSCGSGEGCDGGSGSGSGSGSVGGSGGSDDGTSAFAGGGSGDTKRGCGGFGGNGREGGNGGMRGGAGSKGGGSDGGGMGGKLGLEIVTVKRDLGMPRSADS